MMECKCIKESGWYKIDHSIEHNQSGKFFYQEGEIYEFTEEEDAFGKYYRVCHPTHDSMGFDKIRFNEHFIII